MKSWAWALGASLALHVGLASVLASGSGAASSARPLAPPVKLTEAVFTRVSLAPRAGPGPVAAAPPRSPRAESKGAPVPGDEEVLDSARTERVLSAAPPRSPRAESRGAPVPGDEEVLDSARTERGGSADSAERGDSAGPAERGDSAGPAERGGSAGPAERGDGAGAAAGPTGPPTPDLVALVHARLAAAAEGCYPAAARRFQQRGTVELSFCVDAHGAAADTAVTRSSGAALLDTAARGCVLDRAAPFAPEASARCFTVPVRFGAR